MLTREELLARHGRTVDKMVKILTENCHKKINVTPDKRLGIATLVENFNVMCRSGINMQGQQIKPELLEGASVPGAGSGTGLANVGPYTRFGINLITATMANVIAETLVSVQPMTNRVGEVRYLSYKYNSNKGAVKRGDLVSNTFEFGGGNFEYTSDHVAGEALANSSGTGALTLNLAWKPVKPGSIRLTIQDGTKTLVDDGKGKIELAGTTSAAGTIDYATGAITGLTFSADPQSLTAEYDYITTEPEPEVPEIITEISTMPMVAKTRKLKTAYSFDAAFDLQGDYGFNIDEETLAYFSAEIAHEIDGEIITDLINLAKSNLSSPGKIEQIPEWDPVAPTGVSQMDHDDAFWNNIVKGGNIIFKRLRRGRASYVVAGVEVCNTIETMRSFVPSGSTATGPHIVGTVKGINIVKNPFMNDYEYIVGYLGSQKFDTGYVYAPYMPVNVIDIIKPDNFTFGKGFVTAYGKVSINPKCYVLGTIKKPLGV